MRDAKIRLRFVRCQELAWRKLFTRSALEWFGRYKKLDLAGQHGFKKTLLFYGLYCFHAQSLKYNQFAPAVCILTDLISSPE